MHLFAIPRSLNVERVTLALAHKGLDVEIQLVDPADRADVVEASGQELVPVLVDDDGAVVFDSPIILEHLEQRVPDPPLWPADPARRAEMDVFVDWFDRVWKRPPNRIVAEMEADEPDTGKVDRLGTAIRDSLDRFERLLHGRDYLFGDEITAADYLAFPFLQYARGIDDDDREVFHVVLERWLRSREHPRLDAWIERIDARPRAGDVAVHELPAD